MMFPWLPWWLSNLLPLGLALVFWLVFRQRAQRLGYPSLGAYLRAAPRSDPEKRDAIDLTLKGVVCFVLAGFLFGPWVMMLPGAWLTLAMTLIPVFYGTRKLAYAWMGLGLVDDADQTGA